MFSKTMLVCMSLALLLTIGGCSLTVLPLEPVVHAQEYSLQAVANAVDPAAAFVGQAKQPVHITPQMEVIFYDMTLVQLIREENGYAVTACAGDGLLNVKPPTNEAIILIPNAGDLSADGYNVAAKLETNGTLTFIPRVLGQRIMMTMDIGDKQAGQEVDSLTFDEAMQMMAVDKLIWTARDQGPYGNGRGIEGHIAICDPIIAGKVAEAAEQTSTEHNTQQLPAKETAEMRVLLNEMTLVQLLSEKLGWAETICAGNGLRNITPLPDKAMVLIPNAGDLCVEGSNIAIQLAPDGEITFIPRVQGQRIMMPVDIGHKKAGQEVDSLTFDEAMQLMVAEKLTWTAKDQGPYGNGHGLPGHIAICDPWYK